MRSFLLLIILILAACTSAPNAGYTLETVDIQPATPGPMTLPDSIAPNSGITIPLAAAGTPEVAPTMEVHAKIYDDLTGAPMMANVAWIVWEELRAATTDDFQHEAASIDLILPGTVSGWLVIEKVGYETWTLQVSYQIFTSKVLEMPVRMKRSGREL